MRRWPTLSETAVQEDRDRRRCREVTTQDEGSARQPGAASRCPCPMATTRGGDFGRMPRSCASRSDRPRRLFGGTSGKRPFFDVRLGKAAVVRRVTNGPVVRNERATYLPERPRRVGRSQETDASLIRRVPLEEPARRAAVTDPPAPRFGAQKSQNYPWLSHPQAAESYNPDTTTFAPGSTTHPKELAATADRTGSGGQTQEWSKNYYQER
jgi:hypothetical protein